MNGTTTNNSDMEQIVVYLRISEDRTGAEAGVDRQRQDCLDLCARLGVDEPVVFMDNDISAYGNKKRPGYLELLERVKLGPSRIVAWHVDRLYRKPRELEDLIDLVESHPIRIETVKGGAFDLNAHEGRLMARQLVAIASYESGHKADRIRRANRQKAERGEWHGAPKYGYGLGGVLIPEEAAVIREMADRFLAGQSIRQIAVWLNRDGGPIPPSKGKSRLNIWHASTVRSILCSARISGQRAYDPDAPRGGEKPGGRAIMGPGNWEAIITRKKPNASGLCSPIPTAASAGARRVCSRASSPAASAATRSSPGAGVPGRPRLRSSTSTAASHSQADLNGVGSRPVRQALKRSSRKRSSEGSRRPRSLMSRPAMMAGCHARWSRSPRRGNGWRIWPATTGQVSSPVPSCMQRKPRQGTPSSKPNGSWAERASRRR